MIEEKWFNCWPADQYQNKGELQSWCMKQFGDTEDWCVTSHYDERPLISVDHNPSPFLFGTSDKRKFLLFLLRYS